MKAAELIKALESMPEDLEVTVTSGWQPHGLFSPCEIKRERASEDHSRKGLWRIEYAPARQPESVVVIVAKPALRLVDSP